MLFTSFRGTHFFVRWPCFALHHQNRLITNFWWYNFCRTKYSGERKLARILFFLYELRCQIIATTRACFGDANVPFAMHTRHQPCKYFHLGCLRTYSSFQLIRACEMCAFVCVCGIVRLPNFGKSIKTGRYQVFQSLFVWIKVSDTCRRHATTNHISSSRTRFSCD